MDAVNFPTDVPAELKAADQILKRAKELKAHDPVMCYWCCYRAAQIGVADKRTQEGTMVLLDLLDALEKMKEILKDNDAVTNEVAGQAYVENFALRVFDGADDEDREGKATPATIRKFLAAATFIEVAKSFGEGELEPDLQAKLKYARFKAASLAKAFKAGVMPQPGPPVASPTIDFPSAPSQTEQEEEGARHVDTWSAAATPGTVEKEHEAEEFPLQGGEGSGPGPSLSRRSSKVRFEGLGGDVTPGSDLVDGRSGATSPALPSFPAAPTDPSSADEVDASIPSAPEFVRSRTPSPSPSLRATQPISPDKPHAVQVSPLPPTDLAPPPQPPSFPVPSPSPTLSPSPPPAPAPAPAPAPPPPPPPPSAPARAPDEPLDLAQIEKIQKHAKWAISALNYEDVDTARKELREALRLLG